MNATLLVSCPDRTGIVAAMADFVARHGGNILDLDEHAESETGTFSMRLCWDVDAFTLDRAATLAALDELARRFAMAWDVTYSDRTPRVAVFATKVPHCLYDLLLEARLGELGGEVAAVFANHGELAPVAQHFAVPFHHIAVTRETKAAAEAEQLRLLRELDVDLVVLARYMQILSPGFVAQWPGRVINIHHSFLPAFAGAKPYHQAKERGVKLIGATAHYVTAGLDEGPIIEQDVARVSHRDGVDEMVRKGRELERRVLTRAVRLHLERRVLVTGTRTIVFG